MIICLISDTHYGISGVNTNNRIKDCLASMELENPDVILHAGDWGTTRFSEVENCVKIFREYFPNTPIVGTFGNHDFASVHPTKIKMKTYFNKLNKIFETYNVLSEYVKDDVQVISYFSWYGNYNPPSNDYRQTGIKSESSFEYHRDMKVISNVSFEECKAKLQHDKKRVVVTHFSPLQYRGWGIEEMQGDKNQHYQLVELGVDVVCYGHSHQFINEKNKNTLILNSGSDYNKPKFSIIKV